LKYENQQTGKREDLKKDWKLTGDLENSQYVDEEFPRVKDVQTVLLLDDLKGYVVLEAQDPPSMFNAIQGIRHIRGQLRGELQYNEIDKYLIKKSTVTELSVDNTVEIIGGPFKGMKATVKRVDQEKEEAVVILLDAPYQLPVTVDANHLKKVLS
jgi:transcriptional antiterminator NusG